MGKFSSKAQRLASVITSFKRLQGNTDKQKIYFYSQKSTCFGYLKTGYKKLFVSTEFGDIKEINPLCVLDFYVSEEVQRQGIGKRLFDLMLNDSGCKAEKIAYDRPSEKLLKFLSKHFGLKRYLPQNNNFVVYSQYFTPFSSKVKTTTTEDKKVYSDSHKGVYESKPSYKVTYGKDKHKEYDQTNNIVNKDFIKNLISGAHDSNQKVKRMAVNEESKDGFNNMSEVDYKEYNDGMSELSYARAEPVPKVQQSLQGRTPLVDTTNDIKKVHAYRNPITGDEYGEKPKAELKSVKFEQSLVFDDTHEPKGVELDDLIRQKEAELQQVMDRMSVSSKSSSRKEVWNAQAPKSTKPVYQAPVVSKPIYQAPVVSEPVHGHPSLPNYGHNINSYTAGGMRSAQFHSSAPWATSD